MDEPKEKFSLPKAEEKVLEFWEKNKIFEKTLEKTKRGKKFVFYDGPPFATGLPHYGHILASTVKDVVPRYWTMRGFKVDRRWGWDCHGLPIEHLVEQELGISGRKAIEKFGVKKFNETARSKVLAYTAEWFKTVRRIGRFVDFERAYTTMDPTYMESVWWAFATLYKKGFIYKDSRTSLFCPRCETPLSNFEIAMDNSYRDQEDDSVYVKLPLQGTENEFLLVWTTTPWTLPGNAAVAVNSKIEYTKFKIGKEFLWAAVRPPHEVGADISVIEKRSGKSLIGLEYRPLFPLTRERGAYRVVSADFVDVQEGTGLVHIAPAFGEEDFTLGKTEHLPFFDILDDTGRFNDKYPELLFLKGKKVEEANRVVIEWLKVHRLLWKVQKIVHRYPVCWRCQTPLLYKVQPAWFIKISALKPKMLALNEKIDWHPEHLKHGRFGNGLETAPDWNVSRSRFWGTPIPIWECEKCKKIFVVGSRDEFHKRSARARNKYFIMRHGEALTNIKNIVSYKPDARFGLTLRGKTQVEGTARRLKKEGIDLIFASDITRTKETAEIVANILGVKKFQLDQRLREVNTGVFEGKRPSEYHKYFSSRLEKFSKRPPGGETVAELRTRMMDFLEDAERRFQEKTILIVSHEYPLWMLYTGASGLTNEEAVTLKESKPDKDFIRFAETLDMPYKLLPRNDSREIDFHRPYIDEVPLFCGCGGRAKRITDVFDCWFESGSMPVAEKHYPFDHKRLFEKNFPADFIAEYVAQTRGWFYTLHVLAVGLFGKPSFKHAVTTGVILSEKGEKLSKSRKNFPDPWLLFGRYGVDAIRYYLMSSSVMRADSINFAEKEVAEVYKKFSLILLNVLNFFKLYQYNLKKVSSPVALPRHILDRWIMSRLHSTIRGVTSAFNAYEIADAMRPLGDFVQDLSLWYVRRSRERIKFGGQVAEVALSTLRSVLFDFSRLIAPVTPFLAEILYQDLGGRKKLSVHLEDWPRGERRLIRMDLEQAMIGVRELVSRALRARAEAGIKVRQPLAKLQIIDRKLEKKKELLNLIKEEVNVKEITFGDELKLDTALTPELKEEGLLREFIRHIQEMRRDAGLKPKEIIMIQIQGGGGVEKTISKNAAMIKKETNARELRVGGKKVFKVEREVDLEGTQFWFGVSP